MKPVLKWARQLGNALEFANHVGSPTALHHLLAHQALQAANTAAMATTAATRTTTATAMTTNSVETDIPHLACAR